MEDQKYPIEIRPTVMVDGLPTDRDPTNPAYTDIAFGIAGYPVVATWSVRLISYDLVTGLVCRYNYTAGQWEHADIIKLPATIRTAFEAYGYQFVAEIPRKYHICERSPSWDLRPNEA